MPRPVLPTVPNEMLSSRMRRNLYLCFSSQMALRSTAAPSPSNMPSVMMKRRVSGRRRRRSSLVMSASTASSELSELWSYQRTSDRDTWRVRSEPSGTSHAASQVPHLDSLLNRKVDALVCNDDVSALAECGNDRGDRREALGIDNRVVDANEARNVGLKLHVHVCRSTRSQLAAGLDPWLSRTHRWFRRSQAASSCRRRTRAAS